MTVINSKHLNLKDKKVDFFKSLPFPHIVLDDFLDIDFFEGLKGTLDRLDESTGGKNFDSIVEEKKWISLNTSLPNIVKEIVDAFHTDDWVNNMCNLTGIDTLIATPNGNTKLANYHIMEPGGVLGAHVDHSSEPLMKIPHVLNVIIYLTKAWDENDGGGTLLFDKYGKEIVSKVAYKENRAVIFLHTPYSFHGVERIRGSCKLKRRTIYVDYYSNSLQPYRNMKLGFDSTWFSHGTTFKLGGIFDYLNSKNKNYTKTLIKYHLSRLKARKWP